MRLLLDTHTFLWFVLNDSKLSRVADALITDPHNDALISPATYWDIAIPLPSPPRWDRLPVPPGSTHQLTAPCH